MGIQAYGSGNYEKAIDWYMKAANMGNSSAMLKIGLIYNEKKFFQEAIKWYTKAAEFGNTTAESLLKMYK